MELAPSMPEGHRALGHYYGDVRKDPEKALEAYARGLSLAPDDALLLRGLAVTERRQGRWEEALAHLRRARELDPRSWEGEEALGRTLLSLRRTGEAREACDRGLVLAPANLDLIESKAMTFLQGGDLAGARAVMAATPREVEPTALVAFFALYDDLHWVLDDAQRDLLLRLTPGAFDGDRASWGIVLAQASALRGDQAKTREYAEEARKGFAAQVGGGPGRAARRLCSAWRSPTWAARPRRSARESGVLRIAPIAKQPFAGPYVQHQLVRIHILAGEPRQGAGPPGAAAEGPVRPHARLAAHRPQLRPAARQPPLREARARNVAATLTPCESGGGERHSETHLRRSGRSRVDGARRLLLRDGTAVRLTGKAFDILLLLLEEKGRLVEKDELMRRVAAPHGGGGEQLTVNISALRKSARGEPGRAPISGDRPGAATSSWPRCTSRTASGRRRRRG